MRRFAFQIIAIIMTSAVTTAFAADVLIINTNTTAPSGASAPRFKSRLAPENYSNAVNQVETQTNDNLGQQVKNLFPKPTTPETATPPGMANQPPAAPQTPPSTEITISNPPPAAAPAGETQQSTTTTTTTTRPSGAPRPMTTQPAPQQTDTYTGFGGGSKATTTPAKSGNSTGLGIKY